MTTDEARESIEEQLPGVDQSGNYNHNIIGMTLSIIAKEHGTDVANELIDEFELEDHGWSKVKATVEAAK